MPAVASVTQSKCSNKVFAWTGRCTALVIEREGGAWVIHSQMRHLRCLPRWMQVLPLADYPTLADVLQWIEAI